MKRVLLVAACWLALLSPVRAAEEAAGAGHSNEMLWRVVNFAILAGGLGYLVKKNAGPFFASRSEQITRELHEARQVTEQSERRARAMEERFARLDHEIQEMRHQAKSEMAAEHARLARETEQALRKVAAQAEQDMAAAAKSARLELRAYAAALAVGLAEKRIAERLTPQNQQALVGAFVRGLERPAR